jgi:ABC-type sugar transport system ATPase subunit
MRVSVWGRLSAQVQRADPIDGGQIILHGEPVNIRAPRDAVRLGIGFVPEDRKLQALFLRMTVRENISVPVLTRLGRTPAFPSRSRERRLASDYIDSLSIRTPSMEQRVGGAQRRQSAESHHCPLAGHQPDRPLSG